MVDVVLLTYVMLVSFTVIISNYRPNCMEVLLFYIVEPLSFILTATPLAG